MMQGGALLQSYRIPNVCRLWSQGYYSQKCTMHFKTCSIYSMYACKHLLQLILTLPWYMGIAVHSVYASLFQCVSVLMKYTRNSWLINSSIPDTFNCDFKCLLSISTPPSPTHTIYSSLTGPTSWPTSSTLPGLTTECPSTPHHWSSLFRKWGRCTATAKHLWWCTAGVIEYKLFFTVF